MVGLGSFGEPRLGSAIAKTILMSLRIKLTALAARLRFLFVPSLLCLLLVGPSESRADDDCAPAIAATEQANLALPAGLLSAIGIVESGRRDSVTGRFAAWPWSVNAAGDSRFFATREQAIAFVQAAQASGIRSIDVGCMQINLMYHPEAFASLQDAFTPDTNVRYAARFLLDLYQRAGDWPTASGAYHSATPGLSDAYVQRVRAAFGGDIPAIPNGVRHPLVRGVMVFSPGSTGFKSGILRAVGSLPRVYGPG